MNNFRNSNGSSSANPGWRFFILWILAGAVAASLFPSEVIWFVILGLFHTILLYRHLSRDAFLWGLGTCIAGGLGAIIVAVIWALAVSGVPIPSLLFDALVGSVFGFALGCGQAISLRNVSDTPVIWIFISTVSWAAGGSIKSLAWVIMGHFGIDLFQVLYATGLDSRTCSRIVGAVSGFLISTPAAVFTGVGIIWFLRTRRDPDFSTS
jgi:hypothetical protein